MAKQKGKATPQTHPTNFELRRPCAQCPFTKTVGGYLMGERAREIGESILTGNTSFTCHKTLDYAGASTDDEPDLEVVIDDESGEELCSISHGVTDASSWCAGALIFYRKLEGKNVHYANAMLQIAERLGWYDPRQLDPAGFERVFNSLDELIEHHDTNAPPVPLGNEQSPSDA